MEFIETYKHLEKLCGEVLGNDRRLSAYIEEMEYTPRGAFYVSGWESDYKNLKHYRWVRNQIAHVPGCTESNMCQPEDIIWLQDFYDRIMEQSDPLSLYYKATAPKPKQKPTSGQSAHTPACNHRMKKQSVSWIGYAALFVALFGLLMLVVGLAQYA